MSTPAGPGPRQQGARDPGGDASGPGPVPPDVAPGGEPPEDIFASAARYYSRYREPYPPQLWDRLTAAVDLDGSQTVLDLGCGTGHVAIPLSRLVARVVAVDPQQEMLDEGRAAAAADPSAGDITWQRGDSTGLARLGLAELGVSRLDLVTMGRSFHWMDRAAVLTQLDTMVTPGGAVALLHVGGPYLGDGPAWLDVIDDIRTRYLGPDPRGDVWRHGDPRHRRHEAVLADSPFSVVSTDRWQYPVARDLDWVVGLQFSNSRSTPRRFGDRLAGYEAEIRAALSEAVPSGVFSFTVHAELTVARRP